MLALCLWFYAIGGLPLATAMTLNYMSSVWMALFLIGGAVLLGARARSTAAWSPRCCWASPAWRWCCGPRSSSDQLWHGLAGLLSGMLAAMAYLQVTALGRAGEPEYRIVFYFSLGGVVAGGAVDAAGPASARHTPARRWRCCWPSACWPPPRS